MWRTSESAPDPAGEQVWQDELAGGMSRAAVLTRFANSDENVQDVASQIDDGVFFI